MEIHGAASRRQQHDGGGVKVKFIETQFISSDAASFKSVQQEAARLEDLHELCDFGDLLYAGGARRVDGAGYGFPY
uniref:Uncharacterized protein n=1 Tax=Oryza brachyantha TaxID=4533 RepID=J3MEP3_ORYBR